MENEEEVLLQSVEWLVDHGQEIPQDVIDGLKEIGVPINQAKYANYLIEGIRAEVAAIKSVVEPPEPAQPPVVNVDLESVSIKLAELITLLGKPVPKQEIKIPEQKPPTINVMLPRIKKSTQKFKRDNSGVIISSETTYEYKE